MSSGAPGDGVVVTKVPGVLELMEGFGGDCGVSGEGGVKEDGEWGDSGGSARDEGDGGGGVGERSRK